MAEYIGCRKCDSRDCKDCNLKKLETMLNNGKFDCLMNENRCINPSAYVAPVRHGRWIIDSAGGKIACANCGCIYLGYNGRPMPNYCPNCGAKMDGGAD